MKRTTFRPTMAMTYPLAQGHLRSGSSASIGRPAADHSGYWPAGSMFTSGNDFARFAMALLNQGKVDGREAIPAPVIQKLGTRHVSSSATGGYGYGLSVYEAGGHKVLSHGGARNGYASHLIAVPDEKLAVIALVNVSGGNAARPAERAFQAVAGWSPRREVEKTPTTIKPEQIAGVYAQYTQLAVIRDKGGKLTLTTGAQTVELKPGDGNCYQSGPGPVCFQLGPDGRAKYLIFGVRALARRD
jgi:CubicO group peptidase (beta-lactamase class C family)